MLISVSFFACELIELPEISCSGQILVEGEGLGGVEISSNIKNLTKTDNGGNFSFVTKAKSLTIKPELSGYFFEPSSITISESVNNISFTAIKIYDLEGTLVLKKVIIKPTSIVSYGDNYVYRQGGKDCLRAKEVSLLISNRTYNIVDADYYFIKNQKNEILVEDKIEIKCNTKTSIGFLINTYFKNYNYEWVTSVSNYTYLNIINPQKNSDIKNGQIEYSLYGINSETKAFSFDIAFVFDFVKEN